MVTSRRRHRCHPGGSMERRVRFELELLVHKLGLELWPINLLSAFLTKLANYETRPLWFQNISPFLNQILGGDGPGSDTARANARPGPCRQINWRAVRVPI